MRKGIIFVVSAPSGAGKTSLCKKVIDTVPNLCHSVSFTTRLPRPNETDGVDYNFISGEKFEEMVAADMFVEWAVVHGNSYGTSGAYLNRYEKEGKDILLDIDVQGAMQMKKKVQQGVYIFVLPPSEEELEKRLKGRATDGEKEIRDRLRNAREEISQANQYDYIIINDIFDEALEKLRCIISAERCRRGHLCMPNFSIL